MDRLWAGTVLIYAGLGSALGLGAYVAHLRQAQAPVLHVAPTTAAYPMAHALAPHTLYAEVHNGVTIHFWVDQPAQDEPPFVYPADTPTPVGWVPSYQQQSYDYSHGGP